VKRNHGLVALATVATTLVIVLLAVLVVFLYVAGPD
jgi:hypothetical protein